MNTNDISAFIQVYESKSFNQAAKLLYVSPQGIIKIIQRVEAELGITLFERTSHGITATAAADSFYKDMKPLLAGYEKAKAHLYETHSGKILRVKMTSGILSILSLSFIDAYREAHPDVELFLDEACDDILLSSLIHNKCDLAIMSGPINDNRLNAKLFTRVPQLLVMHKNHPLAVKSEISFQDLHGQKLAMMTHRSRTHGQLLAKLAAAHATPAAIYEAEQLFFNHERAAYDGCLGQTYESDASKFNFPDTVIRTYADKEFTWDSYYVRLAESSPSPVVEEFISFTDNWLESHCSK